MALADELKKLRIAAGFTSQKALAEKAGVSQVYVHQLETGKRPSASPDVTRKLAKALRVDYSTLAQLMPEDSVAAIKAEVAIPLLGAVGAGKHVNDPASKGSVLMVNQLFPGDVVAYEVKGDSMIEDMIREGDYIIVQRTPEPSSNERVVAWLHAEECCMVKRIMFRANGEVWLHAANKAHPFKPRQLRDGDHVYGSLVGVIRKC